MASRSARSSSTSRARAMPWKRSWVSSVRIWSRIVVCVGVDGEEISDHLFQDERLQAPEVEQAELHCLLKCGEERCAGVGAFHLEQASQLTQTAAMVALPERGGIAIQGGMVAAQELLFERRGAAHARGFGVMLWHGMAGIALVDEARM